MINYQALAIGVSAGGLNALGKILPKLPAKFPLTVMIVQHLSAESDSYLVRYFRKLCKLEVVEIEDKQYICKRKIYFAPPNYHVLVDYNKTFSLSVDERVNFSRPSIDVLFETASDFYREKLIGLVLTGANNDGTKGLQRIKQNGGYCMVQNPKTAEVDTMPQKAMDVVKVDQVLELDEIADFLIRLVRKK